MAAWTNEVTLITEQPPEEKTNDNGIDNPMIENKVTVFCNRRSISQGEYYKAQHAGIKAEVKVEVHTVDYSGEVLVEFEGKRYSVYRTYEPEGGDTIELTLTDLPTVEGEGGG